MGEATRYAPFVLVVLFMSPMAAAAAEKGPAAPNERGKLLYRIHCENCHGASGTGSGPMAKLLTVEPADLTTIAARNDGLFPIDRVRQIIDGRGDVRAHGMKEMPVWGLSLQQSDRDSSQEDDIRDRIDDLVEHLRSMQKAAE